MADLLARFKLVDEMSDKLGSMAEKGQSMTEQWERAGDAASAALEGIAGGVSTAVSSVDGIATSIDNLQDAMGQADYWTDAVGSYSKELLEATYSTEELVEMGLKSADALEEQNRMLELCEQSANELGRSMDATDQAGPRQGKHRGGRGHVGAGKGPAGSGRGFGGLQPDDGLRHDGLGPA